MKEITERTLKVENVSLGYGETTIVKDLSLEFPKGKVTAIIGPNGCGKSTLLRGVSRLLKPLNGDFTLDGKPTHEYSMKGFARMVGLMPQHPIAPEGGRLGARSHRHYVPRRTTGHRTLRRPTSARLDCHGARPRN